MIIIQLIGGLGSQMSQYAYAKALKSKGYDVKIDTSAYETYKTHKYELGNYNIDIETSTKQENMELKKYNFVARALSYNQTSNFFLKFLNKIGLKSYMETVIKEQSHLFDEDLLKVTDGAYIIGDFKSEKYFKNIKGDLLEQFSLKKEPSSYLQKMELKIKTEKKSCFVHIRRGDYINNAKVRKIHGVCSIDYYQNAVEYVSSKVNDLHFFVFSNDITWCEKNLNIKNVTYMKNAERHSPNEDIYLMSLCNHSIIDHSNFCWWGAWLNKNQNSIVIAPKRWFSEDLYQKQSYDIYCESWIKL